MEAIPVKNSREPMYPTRREVLAGGVAYVLFSLIGGKIASADVKKDGMSVAPIFQHGEGRGATGCVVLSPPVFLSEEEGMQILREELAKYQIHLKEGGILEGVRIPARMEDFRWVTSEDGRREFKEGPVEIPGQAKPLKLDGIDSDKKIAVEFVSQNDYSALGGVMSSSSVQDYEFMDVAKGVAETVQKQGKTEVFLGVFYDPLVQEPLPGPPKEGDKVDWRALWEERRVKSKKESERLLRRQVQDFVGWLKKQKAIP